MQTKNINRSRRQLSVSRYTICVLLKLVFRRYLDLLWLNIHVYAKPTFNTGTRIKALLDVFYCIVPTTKKGITILKLLEMRRSKLPILF